MSEYHTPVLVDATLDGLRVQTAGRYIDATLGGGGHALEIVKHGGIVLGIDTDPDAIAEVKTRDTEGKIVLECGNFAEIERIARAHGFTNVDGILFDLGVSSHQFDTPSRGFSYRFLDAPLDLRLNQQEGVPASHFITALTEDELFDILARYGEEEQAKDIARAIVRSKKPIRTTGDLARAINTGLGRTVPPPVLSRVFQALRIAVNDELEALKRGLAGAEHLLAPGGRLVVISFHSLEDRIVKQFIRQSSFRLITNTVIQGKNEDRSNPRARSAKLRVAEKI